MPSKQNLQLVATSKRQINRAIKHLGIEIQNNRDGYSYFTALAATERWIEGEQVGDSVMVCYLSQQTVGGWVKDAEYAVEQSPPS